MQIFVGLPRTMKGEEHASARMATEYAQLLAGELAEPGPTFRSAWLTSG